VRDMSPIDGLLTVVDIPLARNRRVCHSTRTIPLTTQYTDTTHMPPDQQVYNLKVDSSGRIALPSEARERRHIATGDTVVVIEDAAGLHIKTREQLLAEVQALFAQHVPRGVLLSDEINAERRSEIERD
jgi:AbrB family looped-hinge helix DNA binding protein